MVDLSEDDSDAFRTFVQWLKNWEPIKDDPIVFVKAWVLGDKLDCHAFSDDMMCRLIRKHAKQFLLSETAMIIYQTSMPGSKLRKWALDQFLYDSYMGYSEEKEAQQCAALAETEEEFSADVAKFFELHGNEPIGSSNYCWNPYLLATEAEDWI